jgi:hypothetical protein
MEYRDEMETIELSKVYMSCIKNKLELTEGFRQEINEVLLFKKLPNCDAASLPYILPLMLESPTLKKPTT